MATSLSPLGPHAERVFGGSGPGSRAKAISSEPLTRAAARSDRDGQSSMSPSSQTPPAFTQA